MVDAGAIAHLAQMSLNPDSKLKVSIMKIITVRRVFKNKLREFISNRFHYMLDTRQIGAEFF